MNTLKSNSQRFDVIILGSGMAGIPAVQKCLDLGAKTAIVIGNLLGGTCLNVGCIPTKAIWQANHMKTEIERSKKFGYTIEERLAKKRSYNNSNQKYKQQQNFVDFKSIMEYQAKIVNGLMGLKTDKIREWGAEVIEGTASLKSKNEVITTAAADGKTFETDKIFIATGSKYKVPKIEGIQQYAIDGDQALKLRELPNEKRIFIIGAGFGGLEYATFFAPFAKSVYLSTRKAELFPQDKDASILLQKKMKEEQGIIILYKDKVKKIEKKKDDEVKEGSGSNSNSNSSKGSLQVLVFLSILKNIEFF